MRCAGSPTGERWKLLLRSVIVRVIGNNRIGASLRRDIAEPPGGSGVDSKVFRRAREVERGAAPFRDKVRPPLVLDRDQVRQRASGMARREIHRNRRIAKRELLAVG